LLTTIVPKECILQLIMIISQRILSNIRKATTFQRWQRGPLPLFNGEK
jgi:hypothetical protein